MFSVVIWVSYTTQMSYTCYICHICLSTGCSLQSTNINNVCSFFYIILVQISHQTRNQTLHACDVIYLCCLTPLTNITNRNNLTTAGFDVWGCRTHIHLRLCRRVSFSPRWLPPLIPGKTDRITTRLPVSVDLLLCWIDGNTDWNFLWGSACGYSSLFRPYACSDSEYTSLCTVKVRYPKEATVTRQQQTWQAHRDFKLFQTNWNVKACQCHYRAG